MSSIKASNPIDCNTLWPKGCESYEQVSLREILKVNLYGVAEEVFHTKDLLEKKGCTLAACPGGNINGTLYMSNAPEEWLELLYRFPPERVLGVGRHVQGNSHAN